MQNLENRKVIDRFTKEAGYEFLSNFYKSTVRYDGVLYPSVEHAYQASKTLDIKVREIIRKSKDPGEAKKLGQSIIPRENWDTIKIEIMRILIKEKFENPFLRPKLLDTKDCELILNNRWNDRFWGVCRGSGENWLGKILMEERSRIQKEEQ